MTQPAPKRVLIFSLQYFPYVGGAEVAIKEITDRIKTTEVEFHMVTLRFDSSLPATEKIRNVLVHRIGFCLPHPSIADLGKYPLKLNKYWFQLAAARKAGRLHERYHFDAVWAMMAHGTGIPAGIFKKKHPEVPYLLTLQEGDPPEYIERLMRPAVSLFHQGFALADELQAISNFLLAWGKHMGFRGNGEVIPNGYDKKLWFSVVSDESQNRRVFWKNQHGLDIGDSETVLITTSRLVHKNAIDDVIRAVKHLPNTRFVILGVGEQEQSLRTLAESLGVTERVHFLKEVKNTAVAYHLVASDIFIRPSRSEGMGNSFIEAMAAGIPVIATQEGGLADFVNDTTAWVVEKDTPEQIVAAVEDIRANPEKKKIIIATAKAMVLDTHDWEVIAKKMDALFRRLFAGAVK